MKNFPATCLDNFYDDPQSVREFALGCFDGDNECIVKEGIYPGRRTKNLHEINKPLFDKFCRKFFSLYYDFGKCEINWVVETSFQLIEPFDVNKDSIKNKGWVHLDDNCVVAGVLFLTPDAELDSGTSLFKLINPSTFDSTNKKELFFKENIDDDYDSSLQKHNSSFVETVRFNNVYNRLISFDGDTYHGVHNFSAGSEPRLTQVFFIKEIGSNSQTPIKRCNIF